MTIENGRRHWYSVDIRELHPEDRLAVGARREISREYDSTDNTNLREVVAAAVAPRIDRGGPRQLNAERYKVLSSEKSRIREIEKAIHMGRTR